MKRFALPVAIVSLSLITGSLLYPPISASRARRAINADFFDPYFAAIGEGRFADAWSMHTKDWRSQNGLAEFTSHYQKRISSKGTLGTHEVVSATASGTEMRVECDAVFGSERKKIFFELAPQSGRGDQGHWAIARATSPDNEILW
jgi:hypothetical protein